MVYSVMMKCFSKLHVKFICTNLVTTFSMNIETINYVISKYKKTFRILLALNSLLR